MAQIALAPYVQEKGTLPTPESAEADFIEWLHSEPDDASAAPEDVELHELLTGGGRGR